MTSPLIAIFVFVKITIIYFVIEYTFGKNNMSTQKEPGSMPNNHGSMPLIIYVVATLLSQLITNIYLTKELCGEINGKTALIYTLLPWILIFGTFNLIILVFPGWLRPFSNTFGYFIVNFFGLDKTLRNILKSNNGIGNQELSQTLGKIHDNPSLLINEISNDGFEDFWKKLKDDKLLASNHDNYKEKLKNLVKLKFMISKFIWYLLVGTLTISTAYNFIIQTPCSLSVKEMEARHNAYEKMVADNKEKAVENDRIYLNTGS